MKQFVVIINGKGKVGKDTLIDLNIVDKIAKNNINLPQEIQSGHLKIVAIPFANNNKNSATFLSG